MENKAAEKVDMEKLFNKLLIVYKKTHVTINGQQAQIECSKIWREIKKGKNDSETKLETQTLMAQWQNSTKKPRKGSIERFLVKRSTSTNEKI